MAQDFDESAAQPVGEVIAELREKLGLAAEETTSDADADKQKAGAEDDQTGKAEPEDKTATDVVEDEAGDDKGELSTKDKAPERSAGLNKILEKYGFDEEKFVEGWYNLQNSTAQVVKRLEAMEERLSRSGSDEPHPDIAKLNDELEELTDDIKENQKEQQALVTKGEKIRAEISRLEGRMEATEDEAKKDSLRSQIDVLKERLETHASKWQDIARDNKKLMKRVGGIESRRKDVEQEIKERQNVQHKTEQSNADWKAEQNFRYSTAVRSLNKLYDMTDGQHMRIARLIKEDAKEFLQKNPEGEEIDLVAFVAARAKVHTKEFGIKPKFVKAGTDKQDVSRPGNGTQRADTKPATVRTKPAPASQEKAAEDAQAARLHARKVLGTA